MSEPTSDKLTAESVAQWTCFHCGETFYNRKCAEEHFGASEYTDAACQIKGGAEIHLVQYIRQQEEQLAIYRSETDAITSAWDAKLADHQQALRRAEETGYNKGVRDMASEPAVLERIATAEREARVRALEFAEEEARRYAKCYAHGSDGRNTFVMFAERMEREAALITAAEIPPPAAEARVDGDVT